VRESEYSVLLKDKSIKRWYDNVARGSVITADDKITENFFGLSLLSSFPSPQSKDEVKSWHIFHIL